MSKKTIIILDDNQQILNILALIFESKPYDITACNTTKSFRAELEKGTPDLILLDIKLPDGNGLDLCKELKDGVDTKHIPIIMLSGYHGKETGAKCYPDAYIEKPFDLEHIQKTVSRILSRKRN
jgi:two-component system phosphate regulon response regulator PhoB